MSGTSLEFELKSIAPENRYKLLTGLIVPRPIAFVSSLSRDGILNAAPFSFFNMFCAEPPIVVLGITLRGKSRKDSFRNIVDTGEFVINIVSAELAAKANACSADFPPEIDEFAVVGLTPVPSRHVKPPRIAESPANLECRLQQVVSISDLQSLVVAEVVHVRVNDDIVDRYKIDPGKLDAVGRHAGAEYSFTRERFSMVRPV